MLMCKMLSLIHGKQSTQFLSYFTIVTYLYIFICTTKLYT